ncbi:Uncharacterised protein [Klebsiella variicola]|nr:Uncharacterised protein [Klebsiella variicola]
MLITVVMLRLRIFKTEASFVPAITQHHANLIVCTGLQLRGGIESLIL